MLLVCVTVFASAASAATPTWFPSLQRAVVDAGDAGAAVGRCLVPRAAGSKAGRACAVARASADAGALDNVSFFAETGAKVGPCKRLLRELDRAAMRVTDDFAALQHCLGTSQGLLST